jgi:hypothetical protein
LQRLPLGAITERVLHGGCKMTQKPIEVRAADFILGELEQAITNAMREAMGGLVNMTEDQVHKFAAALQAHDFEIKKSYVEKLK